MNIFEAQTQIDCFKYTYAEKETKLCWDIRGLPRNSLRQQDLDKSFVADLHKRLKDIGINVFKPDVNSEWGEQISTEILEAIEESRIAVTIFSKDYTSSPRCLEELTKIMECVDNKGQEFFFVFYKVKPSDGLSPLETFEADIKGFDLEKVQRWKDALRIADDMAGSRDYFAGAQFSHWEDGKCIAEITNKICQVPRIAKYPVGIKSRVEEVKSLLKVEFGGVSFIGIWGRGGVGKTTVAREIFDEISCQFEGSCFLNVGRSLEKLGPGGPALLQWKLLIKILKQHPVNVASLNKEVDISQILQFKKVLIVLDDVYNCHQLEYLAGEHGWFGDGSRIITTTRNSDLLCKHDELYRVPELTNHEALELVSWHAFQQGTPVKEFQELSCCIVDYAKGLPVALEMLGSFLYKQGTEEHSALHRLNSFGDGKIVKLLSLSLDAYGIYKDMFLHIACFFRGKQKKYVMKKLNISEMGINILTERSLLYVSEGTIEMHDWIVQMGWQVARDAEQLKPWNRSRLWRESDTKTVFSANQITRTLTFPVAPENESIQKWKYDAFLSFRGDDTRNNFVAHLYKRLEDIGINVFKDDVKLKRGKFISTELLKAIEESRTAIIIFSEDYASSTWCLEELTMIMECVDKKEQKAYPVFYNIEPSDIRMKGKNSRFARALDKHVEYFKSNFEKLVTEHEEDLQYSLQKVLAIDETVLKDNLEKVQRWKHALHKAAGIAGLDVRQTASGNEAESIEKIVNDNFQIMHHSVSATEKYLVGIESRMGEVESLFKVRSGDVCFVGIWGIGGIGKTTVARAFFDKISYQFQGSCFLANVREESKKHGLTYLQDTLLSRLLNKKRMNIASFYEGADMIKRRLCHWKVLIVFDDVDDEHQLEYLVGNHDWFGDGSRIITTTRNQDLLRSHDQLYSVPELAKDEAVEVFSWHAFQKGTPDKEFLELSKSLVDYAKGLPLALKVFGSFLYKRGVTEWRSAIDKLKDTGHEKIVKQLSLSLDGLNHEEKNVFLDIACFFRGRKKDDVITILNSFGFRSEIGIDVLIQKSLLYISEGMVEMHDLIEQMGQQVARNVDQDKPWKHSRIWHEQDIKTVFSADQVRIPLCWRFLFSLFHYVAFTGIIYLFFLVWTNFST
ncbi:uncharacterized protein, partial [Solanum tuberosum]|uniref:uncharacterized protein n=1 Tax=Solanum tuberosum TaxID=4113 RepID=UPI00073A0EF0